MFEQFWQLVQDMWESGMTLYSEKASKKEYCTAAHFVDGIVWKVHQTICTIQSWPHGNKMGTGTRLSLTTSTRGLSNCAAFTPVLHQLSTISVPGVNRDWVWGTKLWPHYRPDGSVAQQKCQNKSAVPIYSYPTKINSVNHLSQV